MVEMLMKRMRGGRGRWLAMVICALATLVAEAGPLPSGFKAPAFSLTDQSDKPFSDVDLKGRPWVAAFVFTNCAGPCPLITQQMVALARRAKDPEMRFVLFSVDPTRDTPAVLKQYAQAQGATDLRMHFLTGPEADIQLIAKKLLMPMTAATATDPILHAERFVIIGKDGMIRATYLPLRRAEPLPDDPKDPLQPILAEIVDAQAGKPQEKSVEGEKPALPAGKRLPTPEENAAFAKIAAMNAVLNGTSAVLMCVGLGLVLKRKYAAHVVMMVAAIFTSAIFLTSYLWLHYFKYKAGVVLTPFPDVWLRPVYLAILISHSILAAVVPPLVITTVVLAIRRKWVTHRKWARPTFWIWLYVSVTGVVVYWMLYHLAKTL